MAKQLSESCISRTLRDGEKYLSISHQDQEIRRTRVVTNEVLEESLVTWVLQKQHQRLIVSSEAIQEQGRRFAERLGLEKILEFSKGWVSAFCKRNAFRKFRQHGESGDAPINTPEVQAALAAIKVEIASYEPKDVYNMDETGLFYNMPPDSTIARQRIEGSKKDKTRITIAFTCNADGLDRFLPLFIGHAAKPRCFDKKTGEQLGYWYFNNKKAWMTGVLFQKYLQRLDRYVNRSILLVIDNASSHIAEGLEFRNVKVLCLPPNTTSKLQPLDAGIIAAFKKHYRKKQVLWGLDQLDVGENPYKVHQLRAMRWITAVWNTLDQSVFANCWRHTGLLNISINTLDLAIDLTLEDSTDAEFSEEFNRFIQSTRIQSAMMLDDFLNPPTEDSFAHLQLTDDEILESVQHVDENEEQEETEINLPSPHLNLPKRERIIALAQVIAFIENALDNWNPE